MEAGTRGGIRTVQALRAGACLLVVAYHAVDAWGAGRTPPVPADAVWANGAAGVDMFFVISGFVMALSSAGLSGWPGAARFAARRLRRIVPLYWLMTWVKLAVLAVSGSAALPALASILASLLFIPSRDAFGVVRPVLGVGWTLQFEMLFYALFALSLLLRRPAWHVALPVLAPLAVAGFFRRPDWPAPFTLANGLVLEFCLGLAVAAWSRSLRAAPLVSCLMLCTGIGLLLWLPQPGAWRFAAWGMPAGMVLAGAVGLDPVLGRRLPAWSLSLGDASYAIYLLHPFVAPLLARAVGVLAMPGLALPVLVASSLAASTLGGVVLHRRVDRPMQRWISGFQARRALRPVSEAV